MVVANTEDARSNYVAEACDSYTSDASGLASVRATLNDPQKHAILPEMISKEPLGLIVRQGDNQWGDVVRWTRNAMVIAEEFGVSSSNVDTMRSSLNPEIRRLLGSEGEYGTQLDLSADWAFDVIKTVGNYGEVFERNIGKDTPLGLDRGLNALWLDGGILYAPPMR